MVRGERLPKNTDAEISMGFVSVSMISLSLNLKATLLFLKATLLLHRILRTLISK